MDPRERQRLEEAVKQGQAFQRLSMHGDFEYFRGWVEKARRDYERMAHDPEIRPDHIALVRALQGYDAINDLLEAFDRAIRDIPKNQEKLDGPGTESNNR